MMNENKSNKKRKRILFALMGTACAAVILSTSTYAWFTANRTVTVDDINVTVSASEGLQISVDGLNWKTLISNADIVGEKINTTYASNTNQLPRSEDSNTIRPVSTGGTTAYVDSATGFLKMYSGSIEGGAGGSLILSTKASVEQPGNTGDFVAFDLFFQVKQETPVYLTSDSQVAASGTATGIQNAARVAFVVEGNTAMGSSASTIQGLHAGSSVIIWEPNYDSHTNAAIANASSNYGLTVADGQATAVPYKGVISEFAASANVPLNTSDASYVVDVTPAIKTKTAGISESAFESLLTLQPGITKIRVYMWVEGQDVDCEDNASGGSLTYSLQISSKSAADEPATP